VTPISSYPREQKLEGKRGEGAEAAFSNKKRVGEEKGGKERTAVRDPSIGEKGKRRGENT